MALLLLSAFIIGALTVVATEAVGLWILIRSLSRKVEREEIKAKAEASVSCPDDLNPSFYDKKGPIWILVLPDKVSNSALEDKGPTDQNRKKEILEMLLRGCTIVAVSATSLSSRKWAKRYPIKVESKDSAIYKGYKVVYIYLETSWEKESWCKALRLASCNDVDKVSWCSKLNVEFQHYLASLNAGYPSFMKSPAGSNAEPIDKSVKLDHSSSKVRLFFKKLAKKTSKSGKEYKTLGTSVSSHEERKINEKSRSLQDLILANDLAKMDIAGKVSNMSDDARMLSSISTSSEIGTASHLSRISDADSNHKCFDEGTLCFNVLISRLFFDAKNNLQIKSSIQNRIQIWISYCTRCRCTFQRALSNMRIPSYIGEVTCKAVDPGSLPPHILAMRVLPSNMNEVWSLEIDLEYLGGMVLDFETRLELRELEEEETRFGKNSAGDVTSDLLEDFEYLGEQLKLSEETTDNIIQKDEGYHDTDDTENSKSTGQASSQGSRWKSLLHSITKQVSQVPISLGIRVSSLCGTIRLCLKPPPSDQIWFGFTAMPDIQFNLESSVGDHKITNGHLALFLISRFKAAIRETLVLPNSESVGIPWMLAEKDDWVPRKAAPFMWYKNNQDSASNNSTTKERVPCFPGEATHDAEANHGNSTRSAVNHDISKNVDPIPEAASEFSDPFASSSSSMDESTLSDTCFQELRAPLLDKEKMHEFGRASIEEKPDISAHSPSRSFTQGQIHFSDDDDTRPRRIGTRERMRGLGKKMGEKLEVKRRDLEEKGRSLVERMRGP
ncbi:hypothetical protein OROGR_004403 [Orobanche gracilis]